MLLQQDHTIAICAPGWPAQPPADDSPCDAQREPRRDNLSRPAWTDWKDIAAGRHTWESGR